VSDCDMTITFEVLRVLDKNIQSVLYNVGRMYLDNVIKHEIDVPKLFRKLVCSIQSSVPKYLDQGRYLRSFRHSTVFEGICK
jgi:hypothetical protein